MKVVRRKRARPASGTEREDKALRLCVHEGLEFEEIAQKLGFKSSAAARRAVERAAARLPDYDDKQYRGMMTERLEHLYRLALGKAEEDGCAAIRVAAGISVQQAKLNGVGVARKRREMGASEGAAPMTVVREVLDRIGEKS